MYVYVIEILFGNYLKYLFGISALQFLVTYWPLHWQYRYIYDVLKLADKISNADVSVRLYLQVKVLKSHFS